MPNNWKTYKLEELSERVCVGFVGTCHKYYREKGIGVPMIRTTNLSSKGLDLTDVQYIDLEFHLKQKKSQLKKGDILIARHGTNGQACLFDIEEEANCLNVVIVRPNQTLTDYKWLLYAINSPLFRNQVDAHSTGSVQKVVNTTALAKFQLELPPLPEQRAIASILSSLDDKIELNLQMNKTLEEMAMTLYKHWFVDFGPFKDGEFVDSELGLIPEGWEVKRLDEILEIKRGGSPRPIQEYIAPDGLHWLKISDATASNSPFLYSTKEFIKEEGLRKTIMVEPGSIILSNSATPGLPRLIEFNTCIHDGWLHFPSIKRYNRYILYLLFLDIKEHLIQQGNGSVFTNLKTDILKAQIINLPPVQIEDEFTEQITPWFERIRLNTIENQTLTALRDTLLPKLISGEVRVKEAEQSLASIM